MKIQILLSFYVCLGFSGFAQSTSKTESSLWIVSDSTLNISNLNYYLYSGSNLISTIKTDTLALYQERHQKYEYRLTSGEYTLVINQLREIPIVITNMSLNKKKITWVDINQLDRVTKKRVLPGNQNLIIIDYESIKPPIYIDK